MVRFWIDSNMSDTEHAEKENSTVSGSVEGKLNGLIGAVQELTSRLSALEVRNRRDLTDNQSSWPYQAASQRTSTEPNQAFTDTSGPQSDHTGRQAFSGARGLLGEVNFADIRFLQANSEYENIRDRYKATRLPEELKLHDSRSGVRKEDQQQYNRLVKSARMVETTFRIVSNIDVSVTTTHNLEDKLGDLLLV